MILMESLLLKGQCQVILNNSYTYKFCTELKKNGFKHVISQEQIQMHVLVNCGKNPSIIFHVEALMWLMLLVYCN